MTLDIAKFISNSIRAQAKIQHLDVQTKTRTLKDIPESIKKLIYDEYGEKYLDDAEYVSFFWGALGKAEIKRLFNVVDKALGKSANKLTDTDFKKLPFESKDTDDVDDSDDVEDRDDGEEEVDVEDEVEDIVDDDSDEDEEAEVEDEIEEQLNEDDEEEIAAPTAHFFLKITTK